MLRAIALALALVLAPAVSAHANREAAADIQPRVDHHIREFGVLVQHFETFVAQECPRFATSAEWDTYAETEIDLMLNMAAHVEQAWVEAKRTGDDTVRQSAKAPRRRLDEAPQILDKLARCAESNGATANPGAIFRRIERDLPKRQAEIALPR
jgi:hypothetical protein